MSSDPCPRPSIPTSTRLAVRTGRNLPNDALLFINILGSTLIQLTSLFGEFIALLGMLRIDPSRIVFEVSEFLFHVTLVLGKECFLPQ
jgi:EAL domain-containing protein (putative c-di-GMP-specific phosphodiesterase class I)